MTRAGCAYASTRRTPARRPASITPKTARSRDSSPQLKDQDFTTTALRVNFLVVDPSGQYETGDPVTWTNKLVLRNKLSEHGGKRSVELFVAPRGSIRYTLDGSEPRDGTPYDGPIAIGDGEVLLRAFAEADGLEAKTEFRFPAKGKKGVQIDDVKPARLVSRTGRKLDSRGKTFEGLKQAAEKSATFEGIVLTVGQGNQMIAVNVGEIAVDARVYRSAARQGAGEVHPGHAGHHDLPQGPLRLGSRPQGLRREARHRVAARGCRAVSEQAQTVDFGAPDKFGAHLFRVEIPASRNEPVVIVEDYGYRGQEGGIPRDEDRVVLTASGLVRHRRHCPPRVQRPPQGRQSSHRPLAHRHESGGPAAGQGAVRARLGRGDRQRRAAPRHLQQVGGAAPGGALVALLP